MPIHVLTGGTDLFGSHIIDLFVSRHHGVVFSAAAKFFIDGENIA